MCRWALSPAYPNRADINKLVQRRDRTIFCLVNINCRWALSPAYPNRADINKLVQRRDRTIFCLV